MAWPQLRTIISVLRTIISVYKMYSPAFMVIPRSNGSAFVYDFSDVWVNDYSDILL